MEALIGAFAEDGDDFKGTFFGACLGDLAGDKAVFDDGLAGVGKGFLTGAFFAATLSAGLADFAVGLATGLTLTAGLAEAFALLFSAAFLAAGFVAA